MNDEFKTQNGTRELNVEELEVQELLQAAGARPPVPDEALAAITAAAREEWQSRFGRVPGQRIGRGWVLALAATLAMALGLAWWMRSAGRSLEVPQIAAVQAVTGEVTLDVPGSDDRSLSAGDPIVVGAILETGMAGAARVALEFISGSSLRLDTGTRVRLISATVAELERGAVYWDSGLEKGSDRSIEVRTALGTATDVGTRFEVRLIADQRGQTVMRVRVREGAVVVEDGAGSQSGAAGEELILHEDGEIVRAAVPIHGSEWGWVLDSAPIFDLDGASLAEYLAWVEAETGWRVSYADERLGAEAEAIILHGSIEGLRPDESPPTVLAGSGLAHHFDRGVLHVERP